MRLAYVCVDRILRRSWNVSAGEQVLYTIYRDIKLFDGRKTGYDRRWLPGLRSTSTAKAMTESHDTRPAIRGGARLVSAPKAGSRARARDERVARGRLANRLGRVWPTGVRVSCGRVRHRTATTHVQNRLGRVWPTGVRVSRSRRGHSTTATGVLGRVWLIGVRVS